MLFTYARLFPNVSVTWTTGNTGTVMIVLNRTEKQYFHESTCVMFQIGNNTITLPV